MNDWASLIRLTIVLVLSILGLALMSHIFGTHFLKNLVIGAKKELTTRMGAISLIGFLAMLYFFLEKDLFHEIVLVFTPPSGRMLSTNSDNSAIIWGLVVVLLGNFIVIAILGVKEKNQSS
jgi:hypothetical protein